MKNLKPETTKQLVREIKKQYPLAAEEDITEALLELEKEDKIHFTRKESPVPTSQADYVFSTKATWYWITIALAIATAISVATIPENAYPIVYLRQVLGVIFVLYLPGYIFIKVLFPAKVPIKTSSENLDTIERIALSFGMSLALVPIVGLILNYTPWGIRLAPITLSLLMLTTVFATAAVIREHQAKTLNQQSPTKA